MISFRWQLVVLVGWLTSISVLLSLVYGLYETDLTPIGGAAYSSLSHTAWALGLAWIVVACMTGYGGKSLQMLFCLEAIDKSRMKVAPCPKFL